MVFPPPLSSLNENEVEIQRSEILRAIRENGRFRLYLVVPSKTNEEKGQDKVEESCKYRVTEQGLRRCQDVAHHHGWRQPCVTTR
ncbi:hypothetical protein V6N13_052193 [Hibiscus sabdariffa]